MLKSIDNMFRTLDENNIQYCHWKSNVALKDAENGEDDLDIIFLPSQRNQVEICLAECGMKQFLPSKGQYVYNGILDYLGLDVETAKIWHLHLHYRLTIGDEFVKGYTLNWGESIVNRRVFNEECACWTTKPEDELLLLFMRISLKLRPFDKFKKISEHDEKEIEYLVNNTTEEGFKSSIEFYFGRDAINIFLSLYNSYDRKSLYFPLRRHIKKELKTFTSFNSTYSMFLSIFKEIVLYARAAYNKVFRTSTMTKKRILPSGGTFVAIIGGDGSGKSTTVKYLTKEFQKKIDVYSVYLGSGKGSSALSRRYIELIGRYVYKKYKSVGGTAGIDINNKEKQYEEFSSKQKILLFAKSLWVNELAKEKRMKLKLATKARNSGKLVIADRYPQINTPGICDGPMLSKYRELNNFLGRMARKEYSIYSSGYINPPDVIIRLTVPTEVALERRPEMSKELMLQKQNAVKNIKLSSRYYDIDTSKPIDDTISKVMLAIWENI